MNLTRSTPNPHDAHGLHYAGFNQDYSCFAIGLNNGFRIYNSDSLVELSSNDSDEGGVALVEMLYRSNYLALVGGGRNPRYPPNKVIIFDSDKDKPVLDFEFKNEVKNVRLRHEKLAVVLVNMVYVYQFSLHPELLHTFPTVDNPNGLAAMTAAKDSTQKILVIPGQQRGFLQIINIDTLHPSAPSHESHATGRFGTYFDENPSSIIQAHKGTLSCIALSHDGQKCATASDKGTLIRVFSTTSLKLLHELRRGMDRADIYSIAFNTDSTRLCVSSDKGTIHVFNLDPSVVTHMSSQLRGPTYGQVVVQPTPSPSSYGLTDSGNRGSSFVFMKDILPRYFSSEWSFAHAKIATESRCIVAFGEDGSTIYAICADGSYYKFCFDPLHGGEFTRDSFRRFIKPDTLTHVPAQSKK